MPAQPLVSALMPAYNEAPYIAEAIESVINQTYPHWELIVVDDGSTDNTSEIVRSYNDPRIRLRQQPNLGRSAARNSALAISKGIYIAITDADDISTPNRFKRQVKFLESHPEIGVISGQMKYFGENLEPTLILKYPISPEAIHARFERGATGVIYGASMYRREIHDYVGLYSPECVEVEDLDFFHRARTLFAFSNLVDVLIYYRSDPRTFSFAKWQITRRYTDYVNYRSRCFRSGLQPLSFKLWQRHRSMKPQRWMSDLIRYIRFQFILHTRTTFPLFGPHAL